MHVNHRNTTVSHTGYGPHTRRDHVLYIGTKDTVFGIIGYPTCGLARRSPTRLRVWSAGSESEIARL